MKIRLFSISTLLMFAIATPTFVHAQDVFSDYRIHPDVWRPAAGIEPGVGSGGDLGLDIPLLTVPGRGGLDYQVSLGYQSGIKPDQESSWVGLGWSYDPGSIVRDIANGYSQTVESGNPIHHIYGADFSDDSNQIVMQPDLYNITAPGLSNTFVKVMDSAIPSTYPPLDPENGFYLTDWKAWKIEALGGDTPVQHPFPLNVSTGTLTSCIAEQALCVDKNDYDGFIVTNTGGVRYVFGLPTLATNKVDYHFGEQTEYYVNSWRLLAILGSDFLGNEIPCGVGLPGHDEDGDPIYNIPQCGSTGSWIKFHYDDIGSSQLDDPNDTDLLPIRYQHHNLLFVETPSHVAKFFNAPKSNERSSDDYLEGVGKIRLEKVSLYAKEGFSGAKLVKSALLNMDQSHPSAGGPAPFYSRWKLNSIEFENDGSGVAPNLPGYDFVYFNDLSCDAINTSDFGYCAGPGSQWAWSLRSILYPSGDKDIVTYEPDLIASSTQMAYFQKTVGVTGCDGTNTYPIGATDGGVRVSNITTEFLTQPALGTGYVKTRNFSYGVAGMGSLTGIPSKVFSHYSSIPAFIPNGRSRARVVYPQVTETREDGSFVTTKYTTDLGDESAGPFSLISPVKYLRLKVGDAAEFIMRSNHDLNWGIAYQTKSRDRIVRTSTKNYLLGAHSMSDIYPDCSAAVGLAIQWNSGMQLRAQTNYTANFDESNPLLSVTEFKYDPQYFILNAKEEITDHSPLVRTDYKYHFQEAHGTEMAARNNLTAVYRTDVKELISGSTEDDPDDDPDPDDIFPPYSSPDTGNSLDPAEWVYHRSEINTRKQCDEVGFCKLVEDQLVGDPYPWRPHKTYIYKSAAPKSLAPIFSESDTEWVKTSEIKEYDGYGNVIDQLGPNGENLQFTYVAPQRTLLQRVESSVTSVFPDHDFTINYDDRKRIEYFYDDNSLFTKFEYDTHGRLTQTLQQKYSTINQDSRFAYELARQTGGLTNSIQTKTHFEGDKQIDSSFRISKEYLNGSAATIQLHSLDATGSAVVSSTELNGRNQPVKVYKPFPADPALGLVTDPGVRASGHYNSATRPFEETTYLNSLPVASIRPSLTETSDQVLMNYRLETPLFADGSPIPGRNSNYMLTETKDENNNDHQTYTDARGLQVLSRTITHTGDHFITESVYDALGQLIEVRPPNYFDSGNDPSWVTSYAYNTRGELISKDTPDIDTEYSYYYDNSGNLRVTVDPNGQNIYSKYDEMNRMVESGVYCPCTDASKISSDDYPYQTNMNVISVSGAEENYKTTVEIWRGSTGDTNIRNMLLSDETDFFRIKIGEKEIFGLTPMEDYDITGSRDRFVFYQKGQAACEEIQEIVDAAPLNLVGTSNTSGPTDDIEREMWFKPLPLDLSTIDFNDRSWPDENGTWPPAPKFFETQYIYDGYDESSTINLVGRLAIVQTEKSKTKYGYDYFGQVKSVEQTMGEEDPKNIEFTYFPTGETKSIDYQHNSADPAEHVIFSYDYDRLGRLTQARSSIGGHENIQIEADYKYLVTGQIEQLKLGRDALSGLPIQTMDYSYNIRDWLTQINQPSTVSDTFGADRFSMNLGYKDPGPNGATGQKNGNISWVEWMGPTLGPTFFEGAYNFSYDGLNRLLAADFIGSGPQNATNDFDLTGMIYDDNGNIMSFTRNGELSQGAGSSSSYGAFANGYAAGSNRLTTVNGQPFIYNSNGSATLDWAGRTYTYNRFNQPTKLTKPIPGGGDPYEARYHYDGDNLRVQVVDTHNGADRTRTYIRGLDGSVLAVYENGVLKHINIPAGGRTIGRIEPPASSN